jgi:DNA-binding IclR family transcriptional regulator
MKSKPVGAVLNALKILEYLGRQSAPVSVTAASRELETSPSTCFTILRTLSQRGYVRFDPRTKRYSLGDGIIDLANSATRRGHELIHARGELEAVANSHKISVTLWRPIPPDRRVLTFSATPIGDMSVYLRVGQRLPLLGGAVGRVMGAYAELTATELREQFAKIRWVQPVSFRQFMADAKQVREKGWATDCGDFFAGMASIAVPVLDSRGGLFMACTGTMFQHRYDAKNAKVIARSLAAACRSIRPIQKVSL